MRTRWPRGITPRTVVDCLVRLGCTRSTSSSSKGLGGGPAVLAAGVTVVASPGEAKGGIVTLEAGAFLPDPEGVAELARPAG